MTVREAIGVLRDPKTVILGYGSDSIPFNMHNPVCMDAFGDYLVESIMGDADDYYEINILMKPVKVGA